MAPDLIIYSRPFNLSISFPSDVPENKILGIRVYPNPTKGLLNIEFTNSFFAEGSLEMYDSHGRIIIHKQLEDNINQVIDLSQFSKGIYLLRIKSKIRSFNQKVVLY